MGKNLVGGGLSPVTTSVDACDSLCRNSERKRVFVFGPDHQFPYWWDLDFCTIGGGERGCRRSRGVTVRGTVVLPQVSREKGKKGGKNPGF